MDLETALKYLTLSSIDDDRSVSYLSQIAAGEHSNYFILPWPAVLMKNCDRDGKLLDLSNAAKIEKTRKKAWLLMRLKVFHIQVVL